MNSKPLTKVQQTRYNLINGLRNDAIESIEKIKLSQMVELITLTKQK